jgi:citrate lyase subunit beta/citryl-CoA lyase
MVLAYLQAANRAIGPVRVNALDTGSPGRLASSCRASPTASMFRCGPGQSRPLAHYLDALEAREGIDAGTTRILTIAAEIAAAVLALTAAPARHARLMGHSWGGEDLMADLGALAKGPAPGVYDDTFKLARTINLMASVAAGVTAYDTVYPDIKNVDGLRAEANDARRMGYGGKIAIHPDQVAIIHEVFTPSTQEIDWASGSSPPSRTIRLRVLTLDGKMLDRPHLVLARPAPGAGCEGQFRSPGGARPPLRRDRRSALTLEEFSLACRAARTSSIAHSTCRIAFPPASRGCRR